jgi:histidine triad (HIT) family protein
VIRTHADVRPEDKELLGHMNLVAVALAQQLGIQDGYRIVINCKERAGQTVPHLHLHLLGGRDFRWPPG